MLACSKEADIEEDEADQTVASELEKKPTAAEDGKDKQKNHRR